MKKIERMYREFLKREIKSKKINENFLLSCWNQVNTDNFIQLEKVYFNEKENVECLFNKINFNSNEKLELKNYKFKKNKKFVYYDKKAKKVKTTNNILSIIKLEKVASYLMKYDYLKALFLLELQF